MVSVTRFSNFRFLHEPFRPGSVAPFQIGEDNHNSMSIPIFVTVGESHDGGKLTADVVEFGGKWKTEAKFLVPDWGIKSTLTWG
jgi:hypothetical protein